MEMLNYLAVDVHTMCMYIMFRHVLSIKTFICDRIYDISNDDNMS